MPGLNEYVEESYQSRWNGNRMKKKWTNVVKEAAKSQHEPAHETQVDVFVLWVEPNRKRDKDNIRFAMKFILDGLVKAKVIPNDTWRWIGRLSDDFAVDRENPRVEIYLTDSKES